MKGIRRAGACPLRAAARAGKRGVFLVIALLVIPLTLDPAVSLSPGLSSPAAHAAESEDGKRKYPSVAPFIAAIERSFRTRKPDSLTSILPKEGKIFVSLRTIGSEAGYYGRDQVHFIFEKIFRSYGTVSFKISEKEFRTSGDRKSTAHCVGFWSYQTKDGEDGRCLLFFVLSLKEGGWSLVHIREAL
jgi:hypothetical protein